eukprot:2328533-Prymnesium_polylepis.1
MRKKPTSRRPREKSLEKSRNPIPKQHMPGQDTRVPPLGGAREVVKSVKAELSEVVKSVDEDQEKS